MRPQDTQICYHLAREILNYGSYEYNTPVGDHCNARCQHYP